MDITITMTDKEKEILESWMGVDTIELWLQHAIDNKIRQRIDASIEESTNLNPSKMTKEEKMTELEGITLPTKEERDAV